MKVILPNNMASVANSIAEDEAPAWAAGTSYAKDAKCVHQHYIYTSLGDANAGNAPDKTCSGVSAKWQKLRVTNHWAMFDASVNTRSITAEGVETLSVTMPFNRATAFAAFRMSATSLVVSASDAGADAPFWSKSYDLLRDRRGRWSYRYDVASWLRDITETGISLTPRGTLQLDFASPGGVCALGGVYVGRAFDVGQTLFDAEPSVKSYSTVTEDIFGNVSVVDRDSVKNIRASVYVHPSRLDEVFEYLKGIINKPAVWIGDNGDRMRMECLTTYGYLRAVAAPIASHSQAILPIEIMGMI